MARRSFYVLWVTRAFKGAMASAGFKQRSEIMRGLVLWAITVLALYAVNWNGWPVIGAIDPGGGDQIRLGICAVAAIIIVFAACFVWQLIVQPSRIYHDSIDRIDQIEKVISDISETEVDRLFLSDMHKEGFRLYRAKLDPANGASIARWKADMDAWVEKVRTHLKARWSVSALHDFEDLGSMGGFQYRRDDNDSITGDTNPRLTGDHGFSIFCTYSAYLKSVDDIIRHGAYRHLGDVHEILLRHSDQIGTRD